MKTWLLLLGLLTPLPLMAQQIPATITIRTAQLTDSTRFTINWSTVSGTTTFDVLTFSNPRNLNLEQFRVVTGNSWTITVPNGSVNPGTIFYASVRGSVLPKYAAITVTPPPNPDSLKVTTAPSPAGPPKE